MSTTAGDQINGALRLLGVLAEGETPSTDTSADALTALNQMIDSWSTERLSVFTTQNQAFTWPASTVSRTLGPSGNLVGNRPVLLDDSTYYTYSGIDYPIAIVNEDEYNSIALKTATSTLPQVLYVSMDFPNVTVYLYPVPSAALTFHFVSVTELTQPAATSTVLAFPPGYLRAFKYNLACEIAPEFGVEPSRTVQRIAMSSKRNIKRINNPGDLMSFPDMLIGGTPRYNIYSGNY